MIRVSGSFAVDLMFVLVATLLHCYEGGLKGGDICPECPMLDPPMAKARPS